VEYVRMLQESAIAHTHHNGWHTEKLREHGWTWVVRSHQIEYLQPCMAGEPVAVYTWVHTFKKIRSIRRYRFIRESDGVVLAEAETDWIFLDFVRGRPVAIPAEVLAAYAVVPEEEEKTIGNA
jgi:acyl-CoA thioester hydrolase